MMYSIAATPSPAILGEPVTLTLHAATETDTLQALTFGHKSLTIELNRPRWKREARVAFPNRRVIIEKGLMLREGSAGGIEDLKAGEARSRTLSLESLFPLETLRTGEFILTFALANEFSEFRAEPARLRILSGPKAVASLFLVLAEDESARRSAAAALLHRMTFHGMDYDAFAGAAARGITARRWEHWWDSEGCQFPWNFEADRSTFGVQPVAPASFPLSDRVGGIAFRTTPWSDPDRQAVLGALEGWRNTPVQESLQGRQRVADTLVSYPAEASVFENDKDIGRALLEAMTLIGELIQRGEDHAGECDMLLATAASAPSGKFSAPLTKLANVIPKTPEWDSARLRCAALGDALIPDSRELES